MRLFQSLATLLAFFSTILLTLLIRPTNQSIGYFENYGWPTYGIVKPFWLAPFSSFPTRQTSGYTRSSKILSAGVVRNGPGTNPNSLGF